MWDGVFDSVDSNAIARKTVSHRSIATHSQLYVASADNKVWVCYTRRLETPQETVIQARGVQVQKT